MNDPAPVHTSLNRRSFLKTGLVGGTLLFVGGGGWLATRGTRRIPSTPGTLRVLDEFEYAILSAVADRMVPPRPGFPSREQLDIVANIDTILVKVDEAAQKEIKQLVRLLENALSVFLFSGHFRPFTQLTPDEQDEVLRGWRDSRLTLRRSGFQALKVLVSAGCYSSPLLWRVAEYPGPPMGLGQADAPVWKGGEQPRPDGNGVFHEELR